MKWPCENCNSRLKELYFVTCDCEKLETYKRYIRNNSPKPNCPNCASKDKIIEGLKEDNELLYGELSYYKGILYGKGFRDW
jgi:hypothetical protein